MILDSNIKAVEKKIPSIDDYCTDCSTLKMNSKKYGSEFELAFSNGSDHNNDIILERHIYQEIGIILFDGLGDKI